MIFLWQDRQTVVLLSIMLLDFLLFINIPFALFETTIIELFKVCFESVYTY